MDQSTATTFEQELAPPLVERPFPGAKQVAINTRANLFLFVLVSTATMLQLFGWPLLLRRWGPAALVLGAPLVVLAPTHWGLIHEAIHGQLLKHRRLNEWGGRLLAITYLLPFEVVRFSHLMHHRFTREPFDRPDVYQGKSHRLQAWLIYTGRLLGGLYVAETLVPVLAFLPPQLAGRLLGKAIGSEGPEGAQVQRLFVGLARDPTRRRRIRRDWLLSLAANGVAFYHYGRWWPALAVTMVLRGVWLSLADNLPHYDVALDEPERARNFRVPRIWQPILMNHQRGTP